MFDFDICLIVFLIRFGPGHVSAIPVWDCIPELLTVSDIQGALRAAEWWQGDFYAPRYYIVIFFILNSQCNIWAIRYERSCHIKYIRSQVCFLLCLQHLHNTAHSTIFVFYLHKLIHRVLTFEAKKTMYMLIRFHYSAIKMTDNDSKKQQTVTFQHVLQMSKCF